LKDDLIECVIVDREHIDFEIGAGFLNGGGGANGDDRGEVEFEFTDEGGHLLPNFLPFLLAEVQLGFSEEALAGNDVAGGLVGDGIGCERGRFV
jgi:hypothetical protein